MTRPPRLMIPGPIDLEPEVLEALAGPGDSALRRHLGSGLRPGAAEPAGDWRERRRRLRARGYRHRGSGRRHRDGGANRRASHRGRQRLLFRSHVQEIAEGYGVVTHILRTARGDPVRPDELAAFMQAHPGSQGRGPDARRDGDRRAQRPGGPRKRVVADAGRFLIVDAVSTFGAARLAVDAWGIGICCTASQKALEAPPGAAPVIVNPKAWEFLESSGAAHHGLYSDLRVWRRYATEMAEFHPQPATMPVNIIAALTVATDRILAEGLEQRYRRYRETAARVRARARAAGCEPLAADEWASPTVTALRPPAGHRGGRCRGRRARAREHSTRQRDRGPCGTGVPRGAHGTLSHRRLPRRSFRRARQFHFACPSFVGTHRAARDPEIPLTRGNCPP